jgi:hypothetical protein
MNSYELGNGFAAKVDHESLLRKGKWICSANIGDEYYESDPCKYKANALSEVLGYLEGIEVQIKAEIESIKKELEER